jgi:PKD repeat protein/pimeloyl-ACP methyl ester carboxylesterase
MWCAAQGLALPSAYAATSTAMSPVFTVDLTGQPPPDLSVENVRFTPASVSIGGTVNVSFRARNLSGRAAVSPVARVRLTSDSALTESDPGLLPLDVTLPTLTAGTAYDYSGSFNMVPGSLLPGSYYVGVHVDPLNQLGQNNTGNDVAVSVAKLSVLGTGGPSLVVLPATRAVNVEASSTAFSIYNAGGGTMAWTASISDAPWIHLSSGSSAGTGPGVIVVTCDANTLSSPRIGTIVVSAPGASPASVAVTVTQPGAAAPQPPVTTFWFTTIRSPQVVNTPYGVTINALDGVYGVQTAFNGLVQLSSEAGGNVSLQTVRLVNGAWSGDLSFDTVAAQTRIIASTMDGTHVQGQSVPFRVMAPVSSLYVTFRVVKSDDTPINGVTITLNTGGNSLQAVTDSFGWAVISVSGAGLFEVTAQKAGFATTYAAVNVIGEPVEKTIELQVANPPVILVPGILGSCSDVAALFYPLLPKDYPASQKVLKLYPPKGVASVVADVGWADLKSSLLASGFSVYEAPWDWRMPVITADNLGKVAWKEYLKPVIDQAKRDTGATKVSIVAHSMGGLLTRAYIQNQEYAGDVDRFAMIGTPNEGSAKAYYLWFGGDTMGDSTYNNTLFYNYAAWTGKNWDCLKSSDKRQFIQTMIPSLEELLPVYDNAVIFNDGTQSSYPGVQDSPLYQLNLAPFGALLPPCQADRVCTKIFYSISENTIDQIKLSAVGGTAGVYPHGTLLKPGDGTVVDHSATMTSTPFPNVAAAGGSHMGLVEYFDTESTVLWSFLTGTPLFEGVARAKSLTPVPLLKTNQLLIAVDGCAAPWITDPFNVGAGISPATGAYTNTWASSTVEVEANNSFFLRDNRPLGNYSGYLATYPGETIVLSAATSVRGSTVMQQLQWIGTTNAIKFCLQLAASGSNALALVTDLPAPQNLWSFPSQGTCGLAWEALTNANVAGYRIYTRRVDESLFTVLATVTNSPFNTGHPWATSASGTNYFYAVVAVSTNGAQSPYATTVMNYVPTLANFSADVVSGTPPLTVAFADHSTGGITNWSWDFNGDGNPDSTEQNPVVSFAQPGTYTVTLTVSGPYGQDTKVSVGYINVVLSSLSLSRLLTNQSVELMLTGQPGRSYDIQVSTDLAAWAYLTNIVPTGSVTPFVDTTAPKLGARFYRAVIP